MDNSEIKSTNDDSSNNDVDGKGKYLDLDFSMIDFSSLPQEQRKAIVEKLEAALQLKKAASQQENPVEISGDLALDVEQNFDYSNQDEPACAETAMQFFQMQKAILENGISEEEKEYGQIKREYDAMHKESLSQEEDSSVEEEQKETAYTSVDSISLESSSKQPTVVEEMTNLVSGMEVREITTANKKAVKKASESKKFGKLMAKAKKT